VTDYGPKRHETAEFRQTLLGGFGEIPCSYGAGFAGSAVGTENPPNAPDERATNEEESRCQPTSLISEGFSGCAPW